MLGSSSVAAQLAASQEVRMILNAELQMMRMRAELMILK
jgi:hypothetical protein